MIPPTPATLDIDFDPRDGLSPLDDWLESVTPGTDIGSSELGSSELEPPRLSESPQVEAVGLRLLALALVLLVLIHGSLLANRSYLRTYDALIHIFFGSHYAQAWFDPWEPRWYTGFSTVSYPPLAHQMIAALSKIMDLRDAFAVVQMLALIVSVIGVYRFSRVILPPRPSGYAALAFVLSSSVAETVHLFGQLPTMLSLGFLLNAVPFAHRYMLDGRKANLYRAVAFMAATTAAHHVTTLFGSVFFMGPIIGQVCWNAWHQSRPLEARGKTVRARFRRFAYRVAPQLFRAGLLGGLILMALIVVVFPYWFWSRSDPILQTPIPHASRDNFLLNPTAGVVFFLLPWASSILVLPYALRQAWREKRRLLASSLIALFMLGTGGTTPLPKLLLGGAFDILTLDRFTFWATILILPFMGQSLESLLHGHLRRWWNRHLGRLVRRGIIFSYLLGVVLLAIWISTLSRYRPFQPEPIDAKPVTAFLEKDEHWRYRYLTLGFGDQMAWLSANTKALTPDGNYHSARRLIELTSSPVERLDGAKFTGVPGIGSLEQFLTQPEKFNLKFVFSNDTYYDPLLFFSGWHRVSRLENGLMVWEREDVPPLPERLPRRNIPLWQRAMWGILPPLAPLMAVVSLRLRSRRARVPLWARNRLGRRWLRWFRQDRQVAPDMSLLDVQQFAQDSSKVIDVHSTNPGLIVTSASNLLSRWLPQFSSRKRWLVLLALTVGVSVFVALNRPAPTPSAAAEAYWDDIDFQRYRSAFARLEPKDGLDFDRFMLDLSVRGGLRNGYAKLERLSSQTIALDGSESRPKLGDRALVRTHLVWATSLSRLEEDVTQELEFVAQTWRIVARPLTKVRAKDRFSEEAAVKYYYRPRRLTTETTAAGDILDRPQLAVIGSRLVAYTFEREGRDPQGRPTRRLEPALAVIGELQNIDARPADVTLTAILRDRDGWELRRNNAGTAILHKLLPGERTPFRVEFHGAEAPNRIEDVRSFEVFAKAVVTGRDLERSLAAWVTPAHKLLKATIANTGTREATVPRALISLYDANGLAWVEERAIIDAILPREFLEATLPSTLPAGYNIILGQSKKDDKGTVFDSGRKARGRAVTAPLIGVPGLNAYRVQLQAFEANP
jgi:hypothetical protein